MYKANKKKYFNTTNPYNPSISEIIPGFLFLSNILLLEHKNFLSHTKVKYILSIVTENVFASIQPDIQEMRVLVKNIPMEDIPEFEISKYFDEAHEFIEEARAKNCKILVHCEGGISRSPTIVISYLMKYNSMTLTEAMEHVSQKRPIICPNMGFMNELRKFEATLLTERDSLTSSTEDKTEISNLRSSREDRSGRSNLRNLREHRGSLSSSQET